MTACQGLYIQLGPPPTSPILFHQDVSDSYLILKGRGSGNNLNKLGGNSGLTGTVVLERERLDHLSSILRRVLHGSHSGGLLGGGSVHEGVEQLRGEEVLIKVDHDLSLGVGLEFVGHHGLVLSLSREGLDHLVGLLVDGGVDVSVVHDDDGVVVGGAGSNELGGEGGRKGEGTGGLDLGGRTLDDVAVDPAELTTALVADDDDVAFPAGLLHLADSLLDTTGDEGVDATAETLVTGDGDEEGLLGEVVVGGILHADGLATEGGRPSVERLGHGEAVLVTLELGGGNHLHRRGNLLDVLRRLHLIEQLLLGRHTTRLLHGPG